LESQGIGIQIRKWLASEGGQAVLDRLARAVSASASSKSLSRAFLMKDAFGKYASNDLVNDVRSELSLFIIENADRLSTLFRPENANPYPFLKKAFINHWITNTRRADRDPQRAFYKRMHDLLKNAEGIHRLSEPKQPLCFSLADQNNAIPCICEEDILSIPFPGNLERRYESINKRDVLLDLARYFWQQVSRIWGDIPVWVDIRHLLDWVEHHVPIEAPTVSDEGPGGASIIDGLSDEDEKADAPCYDRELVIQWAGVFVKRLSQKEGDAFALTYGEGLNLREVAERLNYKGSSGPKYLLEGIKEKLRFFLRDLPWLSPDDLNQEAFSLFVDTLILNLKKTITTP